MPKVKFVQIAPLFPNLVFALTDKGGILVWEKTGWSKIESPDEEEEEKNKPTCICYEGDDWQSHGDCDCKCHLTPLQGIEI